MAKEAEVRNNYTMSYYDDYLDMAAAAEERKRKDIDPVFQSTANTRSIVKSALSARFTKEIGLRNETQDNSALYTNKIRWATQFRIMHYLRENNADWMLLFATVKMRYKMRDVAVCNGPYLVQLGECFEGAIWQLGMRLEHEASGDFRGRSVLSDYNVDLQGIQKSNIHEARISSWDDTTAFFETPAAHCEFAKACGIGQDLPSSVYHYQIHA